MGVGASVAALASVALMARGLRSRDGRAVIAGGAFATMTLLLAIHGLATPGVLLGPNGVVALAGGTALPVGAAILSLAALLLFLLIAHRAVRTFALTRRATDLIVVVGAVWLGVALYPALLLPPGG